MSYDESDYRDDLAFEETLKHLSEGPVRDHLATIGDAIEARVKRCIEEAAKLCDLGFYGCAITLAITAIELMIRFLLLRPLLSGAFLSEDWEAILTERIGSGRTAGDREILPAILRQWRFDISTVKITNGQTLWDLLKKRGDGLLAKRDAVVHMGLVGEKSDAGLAIESARTMLSEVVWPIARRFGLTAGGTGRWSVVQGEFGSRTYRPWDPITGKPFDFPPS